MWTTYFQVSTACRFTMTLFVHFEPSKPEARNCHSFEKEGHISSFLCKAVWIPLVPALPPPGSLPCPLWPVLTLPDCPNHSVSMCTVVLSDALGSRLSHAQVLFVKLEYKLPQLRRNRRLRRVCFGVEIPGSITWLMGKDYLHELVSLSMKWEW